MAKIRKICITCGEPFYVYPCHTRVKRCSSECYKRKGPVTKEHKRKIAESMKKTQKGEGNNHWKGGITKGRTIIYNSPEYKAWRIAVFKRDDFTCQKCGFVSEGSGIVAHHKKGFAECPALRFEVDNGITLCEEHHKEVHYGIS